MGGNVRFSRRDTIAFAVSASLHASSPARGAKTSSTPGFVNLPGGRLSYWDTGGEGELLIFVHPATGSEQSWEGQRNFFAAHGFRVIAYSRWGYGQSDPPPDDERKEFQDLEAVLDALNLPQAHLVGVAGGSAVIAPLIAHKPDRVMSATLVGSVICFSDHDIQAIYNRIRPANFHDMPADFRELSASYRASSPAGVEAWLTIQQARPAPATNRRTTASLAALAASNVPILFATGDADLYAPPHLMRLAASRVPSAQYATIAEAGHVPFWEQPDAFNRLLLDHLRRGGNVR